jgi:hypothetical protein
MKILIVGGTFDENGGKPSGLVNKMFSPYAGTISIKDQNVETTFINGGSISHLMYALSKVISADIVIWFANVPDEEDESIKLIRQIKVINPKCILVESKRNNNEYTPQEVVAHALKNKANLVVQFSKGDLEPPLLPNVFVMKVTDPLGNCWQLPTANYEVVADTVIRHAMYLQGITRKNTVQLVSELIEDVPVDPRFLAIIRERGETFHNLINPAEGTRFLGNSSFRCESGFPSFRDPNHITNIFVTKRDIDKREIDAKGFVAVTEYESQILVFGPYKASVDTSIQLALYKKYPEINFMLHSHVFIKDAPHTFMFVPCGGMEEVEEVSKVYEKTKSKHINLAGHGSLTLANTLDDFNDVEYYQRWLF